MTAPVAVTELDQTIKDLKELKLAFLEIGDFEREKNKRNFINEQRRRQGEYPEKDEEEKNDH
jgi:hypothetical protein